MRATGRLCGVEPKTVLAMLKLAGENCEKIMGRKVRNVKVTDVQCDEIWGFVGRKNNIKARSKPTTTASEMPTRSSRSSGTRNWF